uniref:AB hydrolase-1 domain-containing protein n=1 Tax=Trichuris muris TaxID=70415 RepID=A0A5S6QP33_TRIMR
MADATATDLKEFEVPTPPSGTVKVFVQGNLDDRQGKTLFLTCHDIGANHMSFVHFVNTQSMIEVRNRSIFLHLCVVGQEDGASSLPTDFHFPSLDNIAQDLVHVLDYFNVRTVVGIGEGAGANVMCRFAIAHPNRLFGVILIHCTSTTAGVIEYIKDKVMHRKLSSVGMNQSTWDYLIFHKFGGAGDENAEKVQQYVSHLKENLNPYNLSLYLESFMRRTDLSADLADKLKVEALLVVGSKASHLHTIYTMHQSMSKYNSTLLVVDDIGDVLTESPGKLTRALILFCKGCGVLSGISIPGMELQRTLSSSMEEADRPRKLSLTKVPSPQP